MQQFKDYYQTLGVQRNASADEIKKAYRKIAMDTHPDRFPGDKQKEERFKEASEAYDVLGDPRKKPNYDLSFNMPNNIPFNFGGQQAGRYRAGQNADLDFILNELFRQVQEDMNRANRRAGQAYKGANPRPDNGGHSSGGAGYHPGFGTQQDFDDIMDEMRRQTQRREANYGARERYQRELDKKVNIASLLTGLGTAVMTASYVLSHAKTPEEAATIGTAAFLGVITGISGGFVTKMIGHMRAQDKAYRRYPFW